MKLIGTENFGIAANASYQWISGATVERYRGFSLLPVIQFTQVDFSIGISVNRISIGVFFWSLIIDFRRVIK